MSYYSEGTQRVLEREAQKWADHLANAEDPYKEMTKILGMQIFVLEEEIDKLKDFNNVFLKSKR